MEAIRIDPKSSKHCWFNYSFVHCVQATMSTIRHVKNKNVLSQSFLILHEIAGKCGLLFSILGHLCSGHWDDTFWERPRWFEATVTASSGFALAVVGMCVGGMMGAIGRVVRDV